MQKEKNNTTICKSVFKNGKNTTSKADFTKMWIEMINKIEKNKNVNFSKM